MKDFLGIFLVSLLLTLLNGCNLDELDFKNKLSKEIDLNPQLVIPIAKGNIAVWDIVNATKNSNDSTFTKDSNGLIKIVYQKKDLFTYNVRDLLNFPVSKTFSSGDQVLGDIFPEDVIVSRDISLQELSGQMNGLLDGIAMFNGMNVPFPPLTAADLKAQFTLDDISEFKTVTLSKGTLKTELKNKLKVPLTINGSLFDITNNRAVSEFTLSDVAPGTTKSITVDITGIELSNKLEFRLLSFETPGSSTPVTINLNDYFGVTFNLTDLGISKGNVKILKTQNLAGSKGNFEFDFPEPHLKAFSTELKKGSLTIKTVSNLPLTGSVNFTINEIKDKTTGAPVTASVPMNGSQVTIPLDNTIINLASDPEQPYNRIPYSYTVTLNQSAGFINYSSTDAVQLEITIGNMDFKSVTGDFGKRTTPVDPGKFNLNVDLLDKIKGNFKLDNPSLVLTVHNSIGIPANVALDFQASNKEGNTVALNPPAFDLPLPANINAGVATKNVVINKQNSKIVDFISLPPTGDISYIGKVDFNPSGAVSQQNPNFLDINGIFGIDLSMELPLEIQTSNLVFKDTASISGDSFEKIEDADLILNAKNGIPLDVDLQLIYVDTITGIQYGSSQIVKILSAAQVSPTGGVTPLQSSHTFSIGKDEMNKLRKANGIIFSGSISSPNGGNTVAPILSDSKIEMNVAVKSKVNL